MSSVIRLRTAENFGKILGGEEYGTALEQRIWKAEGNGGRAYANKVREILYALKNNSEIKEKVMKGDISVSFQSFFLICASLSSKDWQRCQLKI